VRIGLRDAGLGVVRFRGGFGGESREWWRRLRPGERFELGRFERGVELRKRGRVQLGFGRRLELREFQRIRIGEQLRRGRRWRR
jgi:hypothetical protein